MARRQRDHHRRGHLFRDVDVDRLPITRIETWGYGLAEAGFVLWLLGASIGIVGAKGDRAVYVAALIAAPIAAVATMGMAVSH